MRLTQIEKLKGRENCLLNHQEMSSKHIGQCRQTTICNK